MAKDLPYFKFEPAEYITGNIQCCSYAAQGLFKNIECVYWQRRCDLTKNQVDKMFPEAALIKELVDENIIKIKADKIQINYLLEQYKVRMKISKINAKNGAKGAAEREKRKQQTAPSGSFLTECKTDEDWKNVMCIKHGVKTHASLDKWLEVFDRHAEGEAHPTIKKYKSHFSNWMNKQPKTVKIPGAIV